VAWIHYALGYNLDFLGWWVLIDYANRLRAEGMERAAVTTIIGMVPVTLSGATSIGLSYSLKHNSAAEWRSTGTPSRRTSRGSSRLEASKLLLAHR
jgi:hypothetical protein